MNSSWTPLSPTKRHSLLPTALSIDSIPPARSHAPPASAPLDPFAIGNLPSSVVQRIFEHVPVNDLHKCALAARPLARFVADERLWARRLNALQWSHVDGLDVAYRPDLSTLPISERHRGSASGSAVTANSSSKHGNIATATTTAHSSTDDDFGDFETAALDAGPSRSNGNPNNHSGGGGGDDDDDDDDDFGTFASADPAFDRSGQSFSNAPVFSYRAESKLPMPSSEPNSAYQTFKRIAIALKPLLKSLADEPTPTASLLFSHPRLSSLKSQATALANIAGFTGPTVLGYLPPAPRTSGHAGDSNDRDDAGLAERRVRHEREAALDRLHANIREAADYLEGVLLSAFEGADARRSDAVRAGERGIEVQKSVDRSEEAMREHAGLIWHLAQAIKRISGPAHHALDVRLGDAMFTYLDAAGSSAALSFLDKRDVLFRRVEHDPAGNIVPSPDGPSLDFTAMDSFINDVLASVERDGSLVARVFPAEQDVLLAFASRVANEIVAEYVNAVLAKARAISIHLYLQACAATFTQASRLVEALTSIQPRSARVTPQRCDDVVFAMWEVHLDDYLQEERDWVKEAMARTCDESGTSDSVSTNMDAAFLRAHNPAAVKRNVLTGFKDVLLMPVTVVPRAAGVVGGAVIRTAGSGLSQLNPLRWQSSSTPSKGTGGSTTPSGLSRTGTPSNAEKGYVDFSSGGGGGDGGDGFALGDDPDDDDDDESLGEKAARMPFEQDNEWASEIDAWAGSSSSRMEKTASGNAVSLTTAPASRGEKRQSLKPPASAAGTATASGKASQKATTTTTTASPFARLQLLLSLDTALQLIQLNRESLKRMETFARFSGAYGARVKEEMEEIAVLFFQCLGEKHVSPGFDKASAQIKSWKPSEQAGKEKAGAPAAGAAARSGTQSDSDGDVGDAQVAPLVYFFELVHVGDTIAQMVQVYYDQELSRHIDRTDFLNGVVREKKRFESALDESVASGLNVGVDLLLGQAEWLITTHQDARDYYPLPGADLDLANPTRACRECVECLRLHCRMLVGSTDKTVLEVFYQEVGIRLHAIICKHLKRQIISLDGGFKVICDLNAYHAFVASLRQPSVTVYFDALKMLANLYIIDNPKELASIVRDASMFNGTLSPEDLYEFLQARSDFKSIEKAIDKEIYGFKATEDCSVM
ncbi:uncharacterized protein PFL1_06733 [Pseudozyma flocculosa PF-1]|uniref:Related to RCY1 - F-box protein involved in recycling plasma membrane proteins n=2 Tax=Pseudozyma flocculosa TaxID=84751 RepID=A0A5C3F310_9BASI|nr:uncharacterized protein PFL1_06733 [Pseudozyma flocculosa PF-1]EPQ25739.1 hypothetical protein PFL1_06733 [Pseudozyma flocculosa PF-1]SPO38884.1 related to RCY1 - F-box protein involved in recycling plasma membrane proteins [Pseudozyma flocculosa]